MTSKTISLSGAELKVNYSGGSNAWLRNDGTSAIYASAAPDIAAGADGVVSIPAGQAAPIYGANGTVYLLGTGSVMLIGSDYAQCPFKTSTSSGGSGGVDEQARAAIEAHAADTDIHVTADEKSSWNAKAELTDIPSKLPADGGNADTLDKLRANEIACNPNLLMNPDFRINQRGLAEYSSGYTADRWYLASGKGTAAIENDGLRLSSSSAVNTNTHALWQDFEFPLPSGKYTLSVNAAEVTGIWSARIRTVNSSGGYVDSYYTPTIKAGLNTVTVELPDGEYISAVSVGLNKGTNAGDSVRLNWIKLEQCGFATGFVPPDYAAELAKCQRFYQIRSTNDIAPVDLRPSMRAVTDIKAVEGGYAYVAEL